MRFLTIAISLACMSCETIVPAHPIQRSEERMWDDVRGWAVDTDLSPLGLALIDSETPVELISGSTLRFREDAHGNQVEYYGADGRAHLWYPGNSVSVPSTWELQREPIRTRNVWLICFTYPGASYNPVTKQSGGRRECQPLYTFAISLEERVEGDPLGLSTGGVPWMLDSREELSLAAAIARATDTN